jgi:hypothetical protein
MCALSPKRTKQAKRPTQVLYLEALVQRRGLGAEDLHVGAHLLALVDRVRGLRALLGGELVRVLQLDLELADLGDGGRYSRW